MKKNFDTAVNAILQHEGEYVNDPADPGKETKYGISRRAYPDVDIQALTKAQAKKFYRRDYWDPCGCDDLPAGLDLLVFDAAVNQGPLFARRTLQQTVGATVDGIVGPKTLKAVKTAAHEKAIAEFVARRAQRYATTKNFERFGLGWMRRLSAMHQAAIQMS